MGPKPPIYDKKQREKLRAASRFNAELMDFIRPHVKAGVSTLEIDKLVHDYTIDQGHTPACLGYRGFPRSVCTSINEVVCHGIPDDTRLKDGDIVNVDLTTIVDGWFGDQSETFCIGTVPPQARHLVQVAFNSLYVGIRAIKPFGRVIDIGKAIYDYARARECSVVREFQGHGIGREFHQDPGIPHFPSSGSESIVIEPGMCFTIEPMINLGTWKTCTDERDGWTVRTKDGRLSAQFEHTILMTEDGPELMTVTEHGPREGHRF